MASTVIGPGAEVTLRFRLALADGTEVDAALDPPLCFKIGDGTLAPPLEQVLYGWQPGHRETVLLAPEAAFGLQDPSNLHHLPRSDFIDLVPEPGQVVGFETPMGDEIAGTIVEVHDDDVVVDFNHPLAGYALQFQVEVLIVRAPE